MGEDNLGLSKLTVVCRALHLFITVSHFYSWHLNVGESDTGALTAGERMLRESSSSGSRQDLLEGKLAKIEWEIGVWVCVVACTNPVFPLESDWFCLSVCVYIHPTCIQVNTHLLHPDSRSLLRSPEDHGFVHGGREQTERLLQLVTCRGRQRHWATHAGAVCKVNTITFLTLK